MASHPESNKSPRGDENSQKEDNFDSEEHLNSIFEAVGAEIDDAISAQFKDAADETPTAVPHSAPGDQRDQSSSLAEKGRNPDQ